MTCKKREICKNMKPYIENQFAFEMLRFWQVNIEEKEMRNIKNLSTITINISYTSDFLQA